jgi:hypothetical protein
VVLVVVMGDFLLVGVCLGVVAFLFEDFSDADEPSEVSDEWTGWDGDLVDLDTLLDPPTLSAALAVLGFFFLFLAVAPSGAESEYDRGIESLGGDVGDTLLSWTGSEIDDINTKPSEAGTASNSSSSSSWLMEGGVVFLVEEDDDDNVDESSSSSSSSSFLNSTSPRLP